MTTTNAIKKLTNAGLKVERSENIKNKYFVSGKKERLQFHDQCGEIIVISTSFSPYEDWCFTYWDNLTQALNSFKKAEVNN